MKGVHERNTFLIRAWTFLGEAPPWPHPYYSQLPSPLSRTLNTIYRCYTDRGIPIPKTLGIWASPSHITLAIWIRVRVIGDAHITRVLGLGIPITRECPYH